MSHKMKWLNRLRHYLDSCSFDRRLFSVGLIFLSLLIFIHFREVRIDVLEVGSHARNYVVAQIDFEFPDQEGTAILKQQSGRDVNFIYQIEPSFLNHKSLAFKQFLAQETDWRVLLPNSTFEELDQIEYQLEALLHQVRFTDRRTMQRLGSLDLLPDDFYLLWPDFQGPDLVLTDSFWDSLERKLITVKTITQENLIFVIQYFRGDHYQLERDLVTQRMLRKQVEDRVPDRMSQVQAGTRLVEKGEVVSPRQVTMIQSMKYALAENRKLWRPLTLLSSCMFAALIMLVSYGYLKFKQKKLLESASKLALYATILALTLFLSKLVEYVLIHESILLTGIRYPLLAPFAAILIAVLLNLELALFTACFLTVILGLSLALDPTYFITANLVASFVAIIAARLVRKRKEIFLVVMKVWGVSIPLIFVYNFAQNLVWTNYTLIDLTTTFSFAIFTAVLIVGLLPIMESLFDVMTDITLMEYMDPNNELLRRLSVEAPGTYQHCLVVGSIAEAAAHAIGANGLFCRVATLYHDIGKLFNPHYFTENQMGGFNIHQLLTPIESTRVILAHVIEGEMLARKHGLPERFIDVIRQHHGTTLVYYFYCRQVEQAEGGIDGVDEKLFRYPGPKPTSKEIAIIMITDTIEAASKSTVNDPNSPSLPELVEQVIGEKLEDGQFDECDLTFKEFSLVKKAIIHQLGIARHARVKYPKKR